MNVAEKIKIEALRRGLSLNTIYTYTCCVEKFLRTQKKELKYLTKNDVEKYLDKLVKKNKCGSTLNVYINSLKFFFEKVLKKRLTVNLEFSRVPKKLPTFLTQNETLRLLIAIKNKKHKLMILLMYSAGLRVSELTSLKVKDFQLEQNYGWVRQGKGNKDRLFILAQKLKQDLINWITDNNLEYNDFLFTGYNGSRYSTESVRAIIKKAKSIAKINKNIHPHSLRHSFATHFIENGNSVLELQPLLGHNRLETTMVYTHMASPNLLKVKSPLDNL